jgi:hypothetical protein
VSQSATSQDWVSGRFRGVYASERPKSAEGARRMPLSIQYGELSNVAAGPRPTSDESSKELRFPQVRKIRFSPADGGPETERTLFDVRIRHWQLLYPAESNRMAYGTLVGELSGRLTPEPVERREVERAPVVAKPVAAPPPPPPAPVLIAKPAPAPAPAPIDKAPSLPKAPADRFEGGSIDQDIERLMWLVVPVLLTLIGFGLALMCSPRTAGTWLVPVGIAIAIRRLPGGYLIQSPEAGRTFGGLCALGSLFVLVGSMQTQWGGVCLATFGLSVALLAVPVVAAAFVRGPVFVWICATIWTAAMCSWCFGVNGKCTNTNAPIATVARSFGVAPTLPPRTDPSGRWPAEPEAEDKKGR